MLIRRLKKGYVKTTVPGYEKDESTAVIINKNIDEFHIMKREREKNKEIKQLRSELDSLRKELNDLKQIILEKLNV